MEVYKNPRKTHLWLFDKMRVQSLDTPGNDVKSSKVSTAEIIPTSERNNLHKSFSIILLLPQIFGFLPAQGIFGPDSRSLHFTWKSGRVSYALLTILGATIMSVMQLYKIFTRGLNVIEVNRFYFYCTGLASGYLYLQLAIKWPRFMKEWSSVEMTMASYGWPSGLNRRLNILFGVFMSLSLSIFLKLNKYF